MILGYLRLVRLPNVFTALADILAGYAISRTWLVPVTERFSAVRDLDERAGVLFTPRAMLVGFDWPSFSRNYLPLFGASAALYLAGMALNDFADRAEDSEIRPGRPIPSGQVSVRGALLCGIVLVLIGIGLATLVSMTAMIRAAVLVAAIVLYNFRAKKDGVLGPITLGWCRFLNIQLGMTGSPAFASYVGVAAIHEAPWAVPLAVGVYAAGLTAFSRQEERGKERRAIILGWLLCGGAILWAGVAGAHVTWLALTPLALTLSFLTHRLQRLGTPHAARDLVRFGVMGICVLDAGLILGFAGVAAWPFALICAGLLLPGFVVAKLLAQKEA
jgi:4-hydroxybenzoate polyprenyltransferase